jgi:hypothetical protein
MSAEDALAYNKSISEAEAKELGLKVRDDVEIVEGSDKFVT